MQDKLSLSLLKICNEEEKVILKAQFAGALLLRKKLGEYLQERIDSTINEMTTSKFEEASWAEKQAMYVGKIQALKNLLDII